METAVITDPAARGGFIEYDGIKVAVIGDDGNIWLALGHHDAAAVAGAFERLAEYLDANDIITVAVNEVEQRWACFTEGRGDTDWWCDFSAEQEVPNSIPVMVVDNS